MNEPLTANLKYYGISPWEIEVIYGLFKDRFNVNQEETEQTDPDYVSLLNVPIPIPFSDDFFKWFEFRRWERVKHIFKEMKRRRGRGNAIKIDLSFEGNPNVRFKIDAEEGQWFNNSLEKIDFVLELMPYHLDPEKLPANVSEVIYHFDSEAARWRRHTAVANGKKFVYSKQGWKMIT